jgi:SecD/SecF fusion protein
VLQTTSTVKRIRWMSLLTIILLAFSAFVVYPPKRSLRLGKDLSGGVSLVYTVQVAPGEDAKAVISNTIDVLKKRVDPQGVSEISMVQQGRDRIEITMPLPNAEVKAKKAAFEDALNRLSKSAINPNQLDQFMRMSAAERAVKLEEMAAGNAGRRELITAAAAAFDESSAKRQAYEAAVKEKKPQAELDTLVAAAAESDLKYDAAREKVLASAITGAEVRRVLELSNQSRSLTDGSGKNKPPVVVPSPREQGMTELRTNHPEFKDELDKIEALYKDFRASSRSLDDPADLQRLIKNAGVLSFRITVAPGGHPDEARLRQELRERGPQNVRSADARWYKINRIENWYESVQQYELLQASAPAFFQGRGYVGEEYNHEYYLLCYDTRTTRLTQADGEWGVQSSSEGRDELGRPSIAFRMDVRGAQRLGNLTKNHVKECMAVLLDDEIYTAPTLQSAISNSGQISGDFSVEERQYIIRVLSAGSLQAKLSAGTHQHQLARAGAGGGQPREGHLRGPHLDRCRLELHDRLLLHLRRDRGLRPAVQLAADPGRDGLPTRPRSRCPASRASSSPSAWPWTPTCSSTSACARSSATGTT